MDALELPLVDDAEREFQFTDRDFNKVRRLAKDHTGISLSDAKRNMVYSRLSRRLRQLGINDFDAYCRLLEKGDKDELGQFINAITTNLTSFFRESHHFDYLAKTVMPELMQKNTDRRIRIWSAGCSTGEEPYSLAMTVRETVLPGQFWDVKILATDLDSNVVAFAEDGIYPADRLGGLSEGRLRKWFRKGRGEFAGMAKVSSSVKELITFRRLNLMHRWPMKGPFDVIFCRNVVIYFDKETQRRLFDRYANLLADHGYLFIGHSETLYRVSERFDLIGNTVYRKIK